ncbi:uncharacterized protein CTHT_0003550 [Thermochaetoides thermophila DSM 1495]|uniref:Uncharacterized protein n=1 Tax=Chaetomium thermophilum (strain DSM 1495 / CBS 144.50 / IMI 039719) TaxID=759272 RepID=G0RZN1_CHATD|nr:hypothetical protein CTHT_0003550 [Thermochaetoides thermophila DSM 1495]EGS23659.1 hypothetical protein CTHT_0003550 [Thermochaetoides thermophila DSM 1495]
MSAKPTLKLSTPVTANFPSCSRSDSEPLRSAVSLPSAIPLGTPLSTVSRSPAFRDPIIHSAGLPSAGLPSANPLSATLKWEQELQKTPITPPLAYLDFLKTVPLASPSLASPPLPAKPPLNRTSTVSTTSSNQSNESFGSTESEDPSARDNDDDTISSPSTTASDFSCECDEAKVKEEEDETNSTINSPKADSKGTSRPNPSRCGPTLPLSAPPIGPSGLPSMRLPVSPAVSTSILHSPRTPLTSTSVRPVFDWEAALKLRKMSEISGTKRPADSDAPSANTSPSTPASASCFGPAWKDSKGTTIRHIREVVTRTVTYHTPRMGPAPKGKRRKIDAETAVKS